MVLGVEGAPKASFPPRNATITTITTAAAATTTFSSNYF